MEPGKTIEWHLTDNQPKFMIFRIKAQASDGLMKEYLSLSLVTTKRICPIASINTAKNPTANQKVRELITEKFSTLTECPESLLQL
jgi:hypothetical protein